MVKGLTLFGCIFTCYLLQAQLLHPIKKEGWGYANARNKIILPCEFDFAFPFFEGKAVVIKEGKYGVIDEKGQWLITPTMEYIDRFQNGIARARKNNKYGYINTNGTWVIEPIWDHLRTFQCGLARTFLNEKFGFIDEQGNVVIENSYTSASDFQENRAVVTYGNFRTYNYIDRNGNLMFKNGFSGLTGFNGSFARGGISASSHKNILGKTIVHNDAKLYYFDTLGNKYTKTQYDSICVARPYLKELYRYGEGLKVSYDPVMGYSNKEDSLLIEAPYDRLELFNDGLAMVIKNEKISFIDKEGNRVCHWTKFDRYRSLIQQNGYMYFRNKNKETVLSDIWGNSVFELPINDIQFMKDGILLRYVEHPKNPKEKNVQFLNPAVVAIAEMEVNVTKERENGVYWNELFDQWKTDIKHIAPIALNGIMTDKGWLYFELK